MIMKDQKCHRKCERKIAKSIFHKISCTFGNSNDMSVSRIRLVDQFIHKYKARENISLYRFIAAVLAVDEIANES